MASERRITSATLLACFVQGECMIQPIARSCPTIGTMEITVLLFASIAEAVGRRTLSVKIEPGDTVASLRDRLVCEFPVMARFVPNLLYALDEEYARPGDPVRAGATLALIPPVSGGC